MSYANSSTKSLSSIIILIFVSGLLIGGLASFVVVINSDSDSNLQAKIAGLQAQISELEGTQNIDYQNITIYQDSLALAEIYAKVKDSVVLIQGVTKTGSVQGSGFVYTHKSQIVVITNYHVVQGTTALSVTFQSGNGYPATVLGVDPYADLAIVSVNAPAAEFKSLKIASSASLRVGESVIAIGNPYGLVGSLTTGVISALGRTIVEDSVNRFSIANVIQTSTPINPGNSGGPMLNAAGEVIGISTAIVLDSQGLAFAIPSNTILREINALITTGTYNGHSYLGVNGNDMNYNAANQLGASVTYGWRVATVIAGGPSDGKLQEGDIIIALNSVKIKNNDDLASYLEEKTLPGQSINITVMRNNVSTNIAVTLRERPSLLT
ncbi:MAG: trypsin-like peptidase domain-containing protein [Candidatus Bathyarchaeota archaeon]|uniref:trypsin-like peptidase domain-containing protein n=1 Tax=Candidatus Bathycorpusculum sp. TaxID=2994959 RepID=UPI00281DC4F0|nr:trypsin-like peptidase domain-containing protein [Candidatus Termiticorpusculum sp.]MCL2256644.1 trypsin-like peptidase domain-containing protein [Candidatus Termiticorpusculum sp.]MCL2293177.1 trypsin-like peptidase domain-containing protein [Candidatus Termiticorpusculum sp.]